MTTLISSKHFRYPKFLQHIPLIYLGTSNGSLGGQLLISKEFQA